MRCRSSPPRSLGREQVAEGTWAFRFARPAGFDFRAGQSVNLTLVEPPQTDARGNMRTFSVASAPFEGEIQVATRMRDTAFKRVLAELPAGAAVKLRGPGGDFTLPAGDPRPVLLVAGGIGITPFVSMLRQEAHERSQRPRRLLCANRRPQDAPFLAELTAMAADPAFTFVATMTGLAGPGREWSGETTPIEAAFLERHGGLADRPVAYLAGPPAMVSALRQALRAAGVPDDDVRTDEFFGY